MLTANVPGAFGSGQDAQDTGAKHAGGLKKSKKVVDNTLTQSMKRLIGVAVALMVAGGVTVLAADAKDNWAKHCAKCHGADGKGQGAMGKKLGVKDYTDPKVQASLKDEEIIKATKEGVKEKDGKVKMKGFAGTLSDDEVKALVKHIREFKK